MLRILTVVVALLGTVAISAGPVYAQASPPSSSPVSIALGGGLSAAAQGNGAAIGGRLTFDLTDRLAIEADASHLGRGAGAGAMSGTVSLLVNLLPARGKTVPYLAVGGGVYGASFNLDNERFFGRLSGQFPGGTQMIPIAGMHGFGMMQGAYTGSTFAPNHMPAFYVDRLGQMMVPSNGRWGMRSFTDPAISVGGGIRLDVSPRFHVRSDARALIVIANGASYTVGVVTIGVGYRF